MSSPDEGQLPVQFVGEHSTQLAEEEERTEVVEEPEGKRIDNKKFKVL